MSQKWNAEVRLYGPRSSKVSSKEGGEDIRPATSPAVWLSAVQVMQVCAEGVYEELMKGAHADVAHTQGLRSPWAGATK